MSYRIVILKLSFDNFNVLVLLVPSLLVVFKGRAIAFFKLKVQYELYLCTVFVNQCVYLVILKEYADHLQAKRSNNKYYND